MLRHAPATELTTSRLVRALRPCIKLVDPYARRFLYRRAGLDLPHFREDWAAVGIESARKGAIAVAETVALLALWAVSAAFYCVLCPPAHAAEVVERAATINMHREILLILMPAFIAIAIAFWVAAAIFRPRTWSEPGTSDKPFPDTVGWEDL